MTPATLARPAIWDHYLLDNRNGRTWTQLTTAQRAAYFKGISDTSGFLALAGTMKLNVAARMFLLCVASHTFYLHEFRLLNDSDFAGDFTRASMTVLLRCVSDPAERRASYMDYDTLRIILDKRKCVEPCADLLPLLDKHRELPQALRGLVTDYLQPEAEPTTESLVVKFSRYRARR